MGYPLLGILRLLRPFTSCHNGLTNGGTLCNEPHDLCKRRCDVSLINAIAGGLFTGVAAAFVVALVGASSRGSGGLTISSIRSSGSLR